MCSCMYVCVVCGYNNFRRSLRIRKNIEYSVCDEKLNIKYFEEYDVHSHASINSLLSSRILQSSRTKLASLSRGNYSRRRKGGGWVGGGGWKGIARRVRESSKDRAAYTASLPIFPFLRSSLPTDLQGKYVKRTQHPMKEEQRQNRYQRF